MDQMKASNATFLDDNTGGKGKYFRARILQAGLVKYSFGVCLLEKDTIDRFVYNFVGCPVIIDHKDITNENAKEERVGVISRVWFEQADGWYWVEGIIFDEKAISLIDDGYNVSCQYEISEYANNVGKKLHNGNSFDKVILNGKPEHLAIVKNPRYENAMIAVNALDATNEKDEKGHWITVKGTHIFIPDGKTIDDVMEERGWKSEKYKKAKEINEKSFDESKKRENYFREEAKKYHDSGDDRNKWLNIKLAEDEQKIQDDIATRMMKNDDALWDEIIEKISKDKSSDKESHGFKKDKDSGLYMKDLEDGTSIYVEKKQAGQGEKEPFYMEAVHYDTNGKVLDKKQYHYDSMDGIFDKIDKDFKQQDKSDTKDKQSDDKSGKSSNDKDFKKGSKVFLSSQDGPNKRIGTVVKRISEDVVEVEFEATKTSPARTDRYYIGELKIDKASNAIIQAINEIKETDMFKNLFKKKENKMDKDELKSLFMECLSELTAKNEADEDDKLADDKIADNEDDKEDEKKDEKKADNKCKNEVVDKRDIIRQIMAIAGKEEASEDVKEIAKLAEKLAYDKSEADKKADNKCKNEDDKDDDKKVENEEKEDEKEKASNSLDEIIGKMSAGTFERKSEGYMTQKKAVELGDKLF